MAIMLFMVRPNWRHNHEEARKAAQTTARSNEENAGTSALGPSCRPAPDVFPRLLVILTSGIPLADFRFLKLRSCAYEASGLI
jgi:hypothetical protein